MSDAINRKEAMEAFGRLLDAVPNAKKMAMFNDASIVEMTMIEAFRLLSGIRQDILDTGDRKVQLGGEESPFVKKIDTLIDRPKEKAK